MWVWSGHWGATAGLSNKHLGHPAAGTEITSHTATAPAKTEGVPKQTQEFRAPQREPSCVTLRSLPSLGSLVIQEDRESRGLAAGEAGRTAPTTADSACACRLLCWTRPREWAGSRERKGPENPPCGHTPPPPTINRAPEPPRGRQSSQT